MKLCPFCAEEIQDAAVKCKHCGEFLTTTTAQPVSSPENPLPWYFRTSFVVFALLCVGPFALPLVWWHPRVSATWKVVLTIVILIVTWYAIVATMKAYDLLKQDYNQMQELLTT